MNNFVFQPGKKMVKSSKSLVLQWFSPMWKTQWKMWITPCKEIPERLLCQFSTESLYCEKVIENIVFDMIRIIFDR